jgi:hypothetical protein
MRAIVEALSAGAFGRTRRAKGPLTAGAPEKY